jgi:protein-serine/threonine kinase
LFPIIQPDNFLFDAEGHLKLADFGLATDYYIPHVDNDEQEFEEKHSLKRKEAIATAKNLTNSPHTSKERKAAAFSVVG